MADKKTIVVVGGVAAGASTAARLRRMDEHCRIIMLEKGPYVSFANCGLPYYIGNVIKEDSKLVVAKPAMFTDRFNIEVMLEHEAKSIDVQRKVVVIEDLKHQRVFEEKYDEVVLAVGSAAIWPPLPGLDGELEGVFTVRTIPQTMEVYNWIKKYDAKKAVVIGGGFIGLEMTENLVERGIDVTVVELANQVIPPMDADIAKYVEQTLIDNKVKVLVSEGLASVQKAPGEPSHRLLVSTTKGTALECDLMILSVGVRPRVALARTADISLSSGAIAVDDAMRTNQPHVWAAGDAVEDVHHVTGRKCILPMAGPANRQGRLIADNIVGRGQRFRGVQGSAVCGVFGTTMAITGASEKALVAAGHKNYEVVWWHAQDHVTYYPGASMIHFKMLFDRISGEVLGAQAVGKTGVEKRIDVFATFIQMHAKVCDLAQVELCYAPQYGAAKDPVNLAGFIGTNIMNGDLKQAQWNEVPEFVKNGGLLVDVRDPNEFASGHIKGAVNIPVNDCRARLAEFPDNQKIFLYCGIGKRSYVAYRILVQYGKDVYNVSGGMSTGKVVAMVNPDLESLLV